MGGKDIVLKELLGISSIGDGHYNKSVSLFWRLNTSSYNFRFSLTKLCITLIPLNPFCGSNRIFMQSLLMRKEFYKS